MERPANGLPEDLREHARLMCDIVALAFQTDKTRIASLVLCNDLSSLLLPVPGRARGATTGPRTTICPRATSASRASTSASSPTWPRRWTPCPKATARCWTTRCLLFLSNMWSGWKHDNMKLPVVTAGGLGGTLKTGRALDYLYAGDDKRKVCSLYLSLMDRMGVKLDRFGDAGVQLAGF